MDEAVGWCVEFYVAFAVGTWAEMYRLDYGWRALLYGIFWPYAIVRLLR